MADSVELPESESDHETMGHMYGEQATQDDRPISLPSGSDDEKSVELPDDRDNPCCSLDCLVAIRQDTMLTARLSELDAGLESATNRQEKRKLQYDCMKAWQTQEAGWRRFCIFGTEPCCQKALQQVLRMTHSAYITLCQSLKAGFMDPPADMRHTQKQRSMGKAGHEAVAAAHSLLTWIHDNMAEHLAESDDFVKAKKSLAARGSSGSSILFDEAQGPREVKWLPPGTTLNEMREFAMSFNTEIRAPSFATFSRVYHGDWQHFLKVRSERQHSKCNDCQKLKAWRRQCQTKADVDKVQKQLELHIQSMKEDRKVDATINMLAQQTAKGDLTDPGKTCLSLVIDGMDENKFKIPKRVEATKQLAALWRPECRFIGCLAEGLTENFFIGDCNLVKDANMDLTIVSHVIHEAQIMLQERSVALPSVLRLHSDNASSELKNQLTMKWSAWVIHRGLFREIHLTQYRVGHSHGKIDQRFSECRGVLANNANMETPAQFLQALEKVKAREGRTLNLEQIHATVDFQSFFEELPTSVSGHTQTKGKSQRGEEAVHVFIFQLRKNLASTSAPVEETFPKCNPHPHDVILSCKHYMSSPGDSQPPQVFLPHDCLELFDPSAQGPKQLCGRRALTLRQTKEFTKTAQVVSQPPWNMQDASAYLLQLVALSQDATDATWQPPSMSWTLKGTKEDHNSVATSNAKADCIQDGDVAFATRQPALVSVVPKPKPAAKKKATAAKSKASNKRASEAATNDVNHEDGDHVSLPSPCLEDQEEFQAADSLQPATAFSAAAGAPPRTVVEAPPPKASPEVGAKGEAAKSKAALPKAAAKKAAAKSTAATQSKAAGAAKKPAAKAASAKRKAPGWLPLPDGARDKIQKLNHSKCRGRGCPACRKNIGLILNAEETAWVWDPAAA